MPKLVAYFDIRPIDWYTGKRAILNESEWRNCAACQRKHARVFVVQDDNGYQYQVGEKCASKMFAGWVPEDAEIKEAKRIERDAKKAAAKAQFENDVEAVIEIIRPIIQELKGQVPNPDVSLKQVRQEAWGVQFADAEGVHVWCPDGKLTQERKNFYVRDWWRHKLERFIPQDKGYDFRTEIEKKLYKLI